MTRVRAIGRRWLSIVGRAATAPRTAAVAGALVDYAMVAAGVGLIAAGAWELSETAGKVVLGAGVLFMGGGISWLVREVRGG
ncbi:MAG: hypothetical protein AB7I38_17095 [Dehalococcoidia bacterium]